VSTFKFREKMGWFYFFLCRQEFAPDGIAFREPKIASLNLTKSSSVIRIRD
jgi:hypothetical protein